MVQHNTSTIYLFWWRLILFFRIEKVEFSGTIIQKYSKHKKHLTCFLLVFFHPPPFPQIWLELFHPSPWVVKGRLSCQVTSLPWSFQDLAKSSQGIVSVVKWTVDMIAWISPKSQIPKIICRMTPFNSTSKACLLFVYAFKHLFTIHVYFNICPLPPFFASYKSTNYISRLSSQNETNLFIETNFWPIQGMHYDPSQDPAMSIGQHCEVLKLKTYLLALTGQVRMNCGSLASPSTKTIIPSSSLTRFRWSRPSEAPGFPTELVLVQMLAVVSLFDHCSASMIRSTETNMKPRRSPGWYPFSFKDGGDPSHVPQNTPNGFSQSNTDLSKWKHL